MSKTPHIPPPAPQTATQPGTWAYKTIAVRFSNTAGRVLEENAFPPEIENRLTALIDDIPDAPIRPLADPGAPDLDAWTQYIAPYLNLDWHQPPWFTTEHYFYRRILEASRYFQPGVGFGVDPFRYQKRMGLEVSQAAIRQLMARTNRWIETGVRNSEIIASLLYLDLWGNQADYSLWPAEADQKPDHASLQDAQAHILVDCAPEVSARILDLRPEHSRIDFLVDNSGLELVTDLAVADYVLTCELAASVCLHVKAHPTFVSDAMAKDIRETVAYLGDDDHPETKAVGQRLDRYLETGRLRLRHDWFWNSPLDGWKLPETLREELSQSSLVISKGDANYRRLLGDRHWPYTAPFDDILSYFPAPILALRTLKSELVCGLRPGQADQIVIQDPEWMVNGRWGLIQFGRGNVDG